MLCWGLICAYPFVGSLVLCLVYRGPEHAAVNRMRVLASLLLSLFLLLIFSCIRPPGPW